MICRHDFECAKISAGQTLLNGRILKYEVCDFSSAWLVRWEKSVIFPLSSSLSNAISDYARSNLYMRLMYAADCQWWLVVCAKFGIHYEVVGEFDGTHLHAMLAKRNKTIRLFVGSKSILHTLHFQSNWIVFILRFKHYSVAIRIVNRNKHTFYGLLFQ